MNCLAASATCPTPGDIRFWRFTQQVRAGVPVTPWVRVVNPPWVCLGPTDPAVRPAVAVPAIVQRDFKTFVVKRGDTVIDPAPETLVNLATYFSTDAPASYRIDTPILGRQVRITARAKRYRWVFGDGTSVTTPAGARQASHTYLQPGDVAAYVEIVWGGTFTVGADPTVLTVQGTATTSGASTALGVREAHSQYESGGR